MSRRRAGGAAVRGPASALTSFLAGLGVEPNRQLTTWGNTSSIQGPDAVTPTTETPTPDTNGSTNLPHLAHDGPVLSAAEELDPAGAVTARTVEAGPSAAGEGAPETGDYDDEPEVDAKGKGKGKRSRVAKDDEDLDSDALDSPALPKKGRANSIDSDDLDFDEAGPSSAATPVAHGSINRGSNVIISAAAGAQAATGVLKAIGEFMACGECGNRFTVTAYTKEHPTKASSWLCIDCCHSLGIDPFAKAKKAAPKKKPAKKEDRGKVVSYETRKGVLPLGDMCIQLIGRYIEDVEQLGDIGGVNMDKVCKIISKSRRLTPETAVLFFSAERTELDMYDYLAEETYIALGKLCPKLESLRLHLCGQLTTDSMISWSKSLKHLKRLELFAPFLVRKEGWLTLFKSLGKRLQGLLITQSPRIDLEAVEVLVKNCPNLTELRLSEVGLLNDDFLEPIGKLKKLALLDISSPAPGKSLTDDGVITLLSKIGATLTSLNLSDNFDLTDAILPEIAKSCPNLCQLYLNNLPELTDPGVALFFNTLKGNGNKGMDLIELEKGHDLSSEALSAMLDHSGGTLERLSIMGWKDLEASVISSIGEKCKVLKDLDMGWCRQVTDFSVKDVLDGCDCIETIRVWGCNQLSDAVPRKRGVKVIGIETHSI